MIEKSVEKRNLARWKQNNLKSNNTYKTEFGTKEVWENRTIIKQQSKQ